MLNFCQNKILTLFIILIISVFNINNLYSDHVESNDNIIKNNKSMENLKNLLVVRNDPFPLQNNIALTDFEDIFLDDTEKLVFLKAQEKKKKKSNLIPIPLFFYTPETSLAFGGMLIYTFQFDSQKTNRYSYIQPTVIYTIEEQLIFRFESKTYLDDETNHKLSFSIVYSIWPDKFYGIGNDTSDEMEENYAREFTKFKFTYEARVWSNLIIGPAYEFEYSEVTEKDSGGLLDTGNIIGNDQFFASGLGFLIIWDSRNRQFLPTKGQYFQFYSLFYSKEFGGTVSFNRYKVDLRQYVELFENHSIAIQGLMIITNGDVPFPMMSQLGGPMILRGLYQGRYRDQSMMAYQLEYRITPLFWRLGIVGFISTGDVASNIKDFNVNEFKVAGGFGLRLLVSKKPRMNIRFDLGFAKGDVLPYVFIHEAF